MVASLEAVAVADQDYSEAERAMIERMLNGPALNTSPDAQCFHFTNQPRNAGDPGARYRSSGLRKASLP